MNKRLALALSVMLTLSSGLQVGFADATGEVNDQPVEVQTEVEQTEEEKSEEATNTEVGTGEEAGEEENLAEAEEAEAPAEEAEAPAEEAEAPAEEVEAPAEEVEAPAEDLEVPAEEAEAPVEELPEALQEEVPVEAEQVQETSMTFEEAEALFDDIFDDFVQLMDEETHMPEFMYGEITMPTDEEIDAIIADFFNENQSFFQVEDEQNDYFQEFFDTTTMFEDDLGLTVVRTQQEIDGMPILGYDQAMTVDADGVIRSMSGNILPEIDKIEKALNKEKKISGSEAIDIAEDELGFSPNYEYSPDVEEVIFMKKDKPIAAYKVNLNFLDPEPGNWVFVINGRNGKILNMYNKIYTNGPTTGTGTDFHGNVHDLNTYAVDSWWDTEYALYDDTRGGGILVYDGRNRTSLPGTIWYDADNRFNSDYDAVAVDAHVNAGIVYDYYKDMHNRNSYDGNDARIKSTVHYKQDYVNAFWNGNQMVYGDGDGQDYYPFAAALDVVGHELTHAVTEYTAGLEYQNESGAINEAMSDIFGTLIEFYANDNPDWLCAEDIVGPTNGNVAMRSLEDPTTVSNGLTGPYPDHTSKKYNGTEDYGGVHINSSIINKCAYLISEGGSHYGVSVDGIGRDKMGDIFYRALSAHMTSTTDFSQLREVVIYSAGELFGQNSSEVQTVKDAFDAVGISN